MCYGKGFIYSGSGVCIWVLVALCYGGLYVHDRAVMASDVNSIVNRELIQRMNEDEGKSRKEINEHLYLLKIRQITKKKYLAWYKVTAEYEVPVSFPLLKKIWLGNNIHILFPHPGWRGWVKWNLK